VKGTNQARPDPAADFRGAVGNRSFATVLADPPWQFINRTGKVAPEHRRLSRYGTMTVDEICAVPVGQAVSTPAHPYLWVPNALLPEGLRVLGAWGFEYKSNIVWHNVRKDGGSDGRGVGFYFRNVTELALFGVRGKNARTLAPGRKQVNFLATRKREHSRSRTNCTASSRHAARGLIWSCLRAERAQVGPFGAIKQLTIMRPHGRRTRTIPAFSAGSCWLTPTGPVSG